MDLPVVQAKNVVKSANLSWIDNLFQGSIPDGVTPSTEQTTMVITEYVNEPFYYANGMFKSWQIGVEVQIFYVLKAKLNFQDSEIALAELFVMNGWRIDQSKSRVKDPVSKQWTKVFYFVKNIKGGI
ncbi:phage tail protein [Liquorilactobacillus aquaticus DSM 21051]|uniref:Phage tail protein n=1 Tax=Liquorilactobacillus aquaticus DSM 21051 TaxID=1423725 RepID=A0A0R2D6D5_9LACO|nr:DUF806 family protein [Liquorilactobacillus aquaticus]KRM95958.1 phage tail protein [Liquorilactobacillus aquaticus DSM 21051]